MLHCIIYCVTLYCSKTHFTKQRSLIWIDILATLHICANFFSDVSVPTLELGEVIYLSNWIWETWFEYPCQNARTKKCGEKCCSYILLVSFLHDRRLIKQLYFWYLLFWAPIWSLVAFINQNFGFLRYFIWKTKFSHSIVMFSDW